MKFLMMIYSDDNLLDALPDGEFDTMMRGCLQHADELRADGYLLDSQQLEAPVQSKSLRIRGDKVAVLDGPFAKPRSTWPGSI